MNRSIRSSAFDVIKTVLKARGMTYADLAAQMGISEPTVKRLFVERDCKFSRLESLCQLLDLSISELLDIADRTEDSVLVLSRDVEQALADSPSLFFFYLLLRDEMTPGQICTLYGLDAVDLHLYLRDLERLNLVETDSMGNVTLRSKAPVRFSASGPLHHLGAAINIEFLKLTINDSVENPEAYVTISRRMRPDTARLLDEDIRSMVSRIAKLARQDRLSSAESELVAHKWAFANRSASFTDLLSIESHPDKPTEALKR